MIRMSLRMTAAAIFFASGLLCVSSFAMTLPPISAASKGETSIDKVSFWGWPFPYGYAYKHYRYFREDRYVREERVRTRKRVDVHLK